jgi:hypothetical protein
MLKSWSSRGWLVIRDGLKDWLSDVAWPRVALTAIGAVVVIGGTLLPFAQQVYQSSPQNPLVVWNQSDWTFWFPFGFFSLHTLTNFPGLVIAIVAVVVVILEFGVQHSVAKIQRRERSWGFDVLAVQFVAVMVIALLVLISWPVTGQGFAVNSQGVTSTNLIHSQLVILRGPGGVVSFVGVTVCLYVIAAHGVTLWRLRPQGSLKKSASVEAIRSSVQSEF